MPTYLDDQGNPIAAPAQTPPAQQAGPTYLDEQGNPMAAGGAPITNNATIGAAPKTSIGNVISRVADISTNPVKAIGDALDDVTSKIENYTQEGRAEHPALARIGDLTRGAKELLTGGQSAGKPLGTSQGVLNSPVTQAIASAPGAAELGAAAEDRLAQSISQIKAARNARTAAAAAQQAQTAASIKPVDPAQFVYREPTPVPQHGAPVEVASPLDNATINRLPGGKDLSAKAVETLKKHIGGTPGAEIEVGSSPKNTLFKAVEPVQNTIKETGLKMNDLIQKAPDFKTSIKQDATFDEQIDKVRDNLPGGDEEKLNAAIDKEIQSADAALESKDPKEVLSYRRKLGSQIDWNDIPRNPETPAEVQNVTKVKLYHALGDKIHSEVAGSADLDAIFQPNLELQSHLDAKLGRTVSRDPVEANAQQQSEFQKGKTAIENKAHNEIVAQNRELAGLPKNDVAPSIAARPIATSPVDVAIDKAVQQFDAPPQEQDALRMLLTPNVKAGKIFGTNTSWIDGLNNFDKLSPAERSARFSNPAEIRSVLQAQARKQVAKQVVKYGSLVAAAHELGIDRYILHAMM